MIKALFEGVLLGIAQAILIGPAFFALIQASIAHGFRSGFALAFGIFLSDALCVILVYLGASRILENPANKEIMGVVGGIALIIFGMANLFQKRKVDVKKIEIQNNKLPLMVTKGFVVNILNPFTSLFWMGAATIIGSKENFSVPLVTAFFAGALATVFSTDVLKSFIALKISNALKPEMLTKLNRVAGLILILFGISLIYRVMP